MGLKNKIEDLKNWFNNIETKSETENFIKAKLVDGTDVFVDGDEFIVGATLMVATETENVPAPEGNLELEDGTVLVIDADGIILEIRAVEIQEMKTEKVETEKTDLTETKTEIDLTTKTDSDKFTVLENRISELETTIENFVDSMLEKKTEIDKITSENEELKTKNEELSKIPLKKPTGDKKFERVIPRTEKTKRTFQERIELLRDNNKQ